MRDQRRWLPILIFILIVLCILVYLLLRPQIPIIPGTRTPTPTPTGGRELPTPTPTPSATMIPKPVWGPGNYILVRRDDFSPATPPPAGFPALASHIDVYWDRVPAAGAAFDWSSIETKVSQIAAQQLTLADGRRIARPVWLTLPVLWTQGTVNSRGQRFCNNNVPQSVKNVAPDHVITVTPPGVPAYTQNVLLSTTPI